MYGGTVCGGTMHVSTVCGGTVSSASLTLLLKPPAPPTATQEAGSRVGCSRAGRL